MPETDPVVNPGAFAAGPGAPGHAGGPGEIRAWTSPGPGEHERELENPLRPGRFAEFVGQARVVDAYRPAALELQGVLGWGRAQWDQGHDQTGAAEASHSVGLHSSA